MSLPSRTRRIVSSSLSAACSWRSHKKVPSLQSWPPLNRSHLSQSRWSGKYHWSNNVRRKPFFFFEEMGSPLGTWIQNPLEFLTGSSFSVSYLMRAYGHASWKKKYIKKGHESECMKKNKSWQTASAYTSFHLVIAQLTPKKIILNDLIPCGGNAPCQLLQLCKRSWKSRLFLLLLRSIHRYECPQTASRNQPRYQLLSRFRWPHGLYDPCLCRSREDRGICIFVHLCVLYVWLYSRQRLCLVFCVLVFNDEYKKCVWKLLPM